TFASDSRETEMRALGMDRLQHAVLPEGQARPEGQAGSVLAIRSAPAASKAAMLSRFTFSPVAGGIRVDLRQEPETDLGVPLLHEGFSFSVPARYTRVAWKGYGPGERYPDTGLGARFGEFRATVAELATPYVFPQENGQRSGIAWLELTDDGGTGLRLRATDAAGLAITVRPWSTAELDAARHHGELVPGDRVWVTVSLAQRGMGSNACGPALDPRWAIGGSPVSASVVLEGI
ncbi:MAG: hypothetical protein ACHP7K_01740, partial [Actinomycetales bacterium]